jgi:predicted TIM-barrel fold metal-dependent hydrolase
MVNQMLAVNPTVIDADSHILEPADLWTSRVASKYKDLVPRVEIEPKTNHSHWRIGDYWLWPAGYWAQAGFDQYPPLQPWEFEDVDPASYDAVERLKRLDEYGVDAQLLYPNVVGFQAPRMLELGPELATICVRAYNDFLLEWASANIDRLIPIAMLPYWDREASVAEMKRCVELGHRGVLFANKFERVGLPTFSDPYWDPIYATAQDLGVPVNYHIGFALPEFAEEFFGADLLAAKRTQLETVRFNKALIAASMLMTQCDVVGRLVTSDLCDRFPRLDFVSVETGLGQMPFYLEALDWHWKAYGNPSRELLPSEYFKRQCYGTFWFERSTLSLLAEYPNNFMFSTDYPHPTSLSPGPASSAVPAKQHIAEAFADVDPLLAAKALNGNAARVYSLDLEAKSL